MCFWAISVAAQNDTPLQVKKGRIFTSDGYKITFTSLTTTAENFSFKKTGATSATELPNSKVLRVQQETGNEAGKWAAIMGASGLLGSLLGVAQAKAETGAESVNGAPIVLGLTALSAGIGALIGMNKKKYKTVWEKPMNTTGFRTTPQLGIQTAGSSGIGLGLRWRF